MNRKRSEPEELKTARKLYVMLYSQCEGNISMLDRVEQELLGKLDAYIKSFRALAFIRSLTR